MLWKDGLKFEEGCKKWEKEEEESMQVRNGVGMGHGEEEAGV